MNVSKSSHKHRRAAKLPRWTSEPATAEEALLVALVGEPNAYGSDPIAALSVRIADELSALQGLAANADDPNAVETMIGAVKGKADALSWLLNEEH